MKGLLLDLIRIIWRVLEVLIIERSAPEEQGFAVLVSLIMLGIILAFIAFLCVKALQGAYNVARNIIISERRMRRKRRRSALREGKSTHKINDDITMIIGDTVSA